MKERVESKSTPKLDAVYSYRRMRYYNIISDKRNVISVLFVSLIIYGITMSPSYNDNYFNKICLPLFNL